MALHPCKQCGRHVREDDANCPFCDTSLVRTTLTRAGVLLSAGAAILGCQSGTGDPNAPTRTIGNPTAQPNNDTLAVPAYGGPPPMPTPLVTTTPTPTVTATAAPTATVKPVPTAPHTSVAVPAYGGPPPKIPPLG